MATTRFLSGTSVWREIQGRAENARRVEAAIAYFGGEGAKLLPMGKDNILVVDMSLRAVRQGATDPREIRHLMKRGVKVFTRASLHAKFVLIGNTLIAGSMNASRHSQRSLDEAATLTTDAACVKRARAYLGRLCTEPVRSAYLRECLAAYQPPHFKGFAGAGRPAHRRKHPRRAKVWFIGGLTYVDIPEAEKEQLKGIIRRVAARHHLPEVRVTEIHYAGRQAFFDSARPLEDWIVCCVRDSGSGTRYVEAPARLLGVEKYPRGRGKWRWVTLLEEPTKAEHMLLRSFRARIRGMIPELNKERPRTRPISDEELADAVLRLWTHTGRVA